MPYEAPPVRIGDLRWQVTIATRGQAPDPSGTGIVEVFQNPVTAWASIKPIGLQMYIAGEEIDGGPTHRIVLRWMDGLDTFDVVLVSMRRPDGSTRQSLYRIFRISELEGRQRFTCIDAILERTETE